MNLFELTPPKKGCSAVLAVPFVCLLAGLLALGLVLA